MNILTPYELTAPVHSISAEPVPFQWFPLVGGFLRRRILGIMFCTLLTVALAAAYLSQTPLTYTATTTLLLDSRRADAFLQSTGVLDAQALNAQIESQVEILRSEGLARHVVTKLNLAGTVTGKPSGKSLIESAPYPILAQLGIELPVKKASDNASRETEAAETLTRMTSVRRVGLTYVIELNVTAGGPESAAKLANAISEAYVEDQLNAKSAATKQATAWLRARIAELNTQALDADKAVQVYKNANNIVTTQDAPINERQLTILSAKQATLHADTVAAKAALDRSLLVRASGGSAGDVVGNGLQSSVIVNLRQKLIDVQRQYADWSVRYGASHQAVRRLANEITELQRGIDSELSRIVGTATNTYEIAQANENSVKTQVDALLGQTSQINRDRVELRALQSQADTYRALYASFLQRYTQAAQDQSFPVSEVQVISNATAPLLKSGPKRALILGASTVGGLGLGLAFGFLREMASQGFNRGKLPRSARGLECLGTLPLLGPPPSRLKSMFWMVGVLFGARRPTALTLPRSGPRGLLRLAADRPDTMFGKSVAELREQVLHRVGPLREGRIIGCLARNSGEGTSTVSANLAYALAAAGRRTVLMDMTQGAQTLTDVLGLRARQAGVGEPTEIKPHQDRATGLVFRPRVAASTAESTSRTTELELAAAPGSVTADSLIQNLRRNYEFIILDLPATDSASKPHAIIQQVDDLLMVARWTPQDEAEMFEAPDMTAAHAVRCLGVVLTMVPPSLCDMV